MQARKTSNEHPLPRFRPSWWLRGAHAQTIGARILRRQTGVPMVRERFATPDGDFLDLDMDPTLLSRIGDDRPVVLLLHGLEGSARSSYAIETFRRLSRKGLRWVGLNFRSCSGQDNRARRLYHSGETTDLAFVLDWLKRRFPGRRTAAVGFSLGGNVLLKHLGERGSVAADHLAAAVAISVPYDLAAGARFLEGGMGSFYTRTLLRPMQAKVRRRRAEWEDQIEGERALRARTFYDFDDAITAPLHGFAGADDYYRQSSSGRYLGGIQVPTLLIQAEDDPFVPATAIPRQTIRANTRLEAIINDNGGHVGFVTGPNPLRPRFWAESTAADWLQRALNH